ncbi:MAG: 2,5-diamino-6-(ribosylamino)-4(3H)-pyrimidinone 5'-phosphate reductase [Methanobacteriota archaeon]
MRRPKVIINCAMSVDGKIALPSRRQLRISSDEDIRRMYELRNTCDAVLVGVGTILTDNPKLTVKESVVPHPKQPLRVVLDSSCRTPTDALVLNTAAKTLILTVKGNEKPYTGDHIQVISCDADDEGHISLPCALDVLASNGVRTVLVEGGGTVIWNFLRQHLVDDLYVYIGSCIIGGMQTPTLADGNGIPTEHELIRLTLKNTTKVGSGLLLHYQLRV